ncbi:cell division protein FtsL [Cognatishimia sp. F0-27]|uniref:cell division protein FtsL n=1 Tax=Cognatishimia sp. F0-27 TaxID=2816855 RepID=UPI001D0C4E76|nr:cell division protein FtsL [Cognatishimia sp. F0-27]MCC1491519.1 cell division protein FtsL [Cognatishimia sp. F0-27]
MRSFLYLLTALAVIGTGFWAYRENYTTKEALDRVDALNRDIREARERLAILNAEWAYLNRPDRLRDLAELNFDRLGLLPLRSDQFGIAEQVIFPTPEPVDFDGAIDVTSLGAAQGRAEP